MLGNAAPTPYDLRFVLFGIPVRVHPFFWLFTIMMGWNPDHPQTMVIWVACVFLSILVHELGHALTAQFFGWPPEIVLYSFGGYASFLPGRGYTTLRAVITLLAGPGAGFLLFGLLFLANRVLDLESTALPPLCELGLVYLVYINLWWGLVNLLPVYPLDGGQICRHLAEHWRPRDGLQISLKLSLVTAAVVAGYCFSIESRYAGIMFALLAFESYQALRGGMYR